ncbi:hypothetical protein E8P82_03435 [Arthrobacter echini]|uniref:Uncharacterized protein n=1 Tax=Arthrobacter echini TaxID=1529066 RepID=A0A4S5E8A7_9MICC|nr:hypothetical protein [Arthrobacter echini]THJ67895.1 hypothetical protein E8P82_03435 [Arthrobacter echini]
MFLELIVAATTPSDEATLRPDIDPASVTPGIEGFLATLFVVVLVIFLIRDMVKRIRRVRYAGEVEQARAHQQATTPGGGSPTVPGQVPGDRRRSSGGHPASGGKHGPDTR